MYETLSIVLAVISAAAFIFGFIKIMVNYDEFDHRFNISNHWMFKWHYQLRRYRLTRHQSSLSKYKVILDSYTQLLMFNINRIHNELELGIKDTSLIETQLSHSLNALQRDAELVITDIDFLMDKVLVLVGGNVKLHRTFINNDKVIKSLHHRLSVRSFNAKCKTLGLKIQDLQHHRSTTTLSIQS